MRILEKYLANDFKGFDWLNFEHLPKSNGYKFEIYFKASENLVHESIISFYILFKDFSSDILVQPFEPDSQWGDFCLDTWDFENDKYDYSIENKKEPTASYLSMLRDSEIEADYLGFCKCINWDKFLYLSLNCVMDHVAPYSMMFYIPSKGIVFYFHHTGSIGIYYKELNSTILDIVNIAREENMQIENTDDKRI